MKQLTQAGKQVCPLLSFLEHVCRSHWDKHLSTLELRVGSGQHRATKYPSFVKITSSHLDARPNTPTTQTYTNTQLHPAPMATTLLSSRPFWRLSPISFPLNSSSAPFLFLFLSPWHRLENLDELHAHTNRGVPALSRGRYIDWMNERERRNVLGQWAGTDTANVE